MADSKLSALPVVPSALAAQEIYTNNAGASSALTVDQLKQYIAAQLGFVGINLVLAGTLAGPGGTLSVVGNIAATGEFSLTEITAPALSGAGQSVIYMDDVTHTLLVSENGGAFEPLVGGGSGGGLLVAAAGTANYGTVSLGAVDAITSGSYNLGIGTNALTAVTTGSRNLGIGELAGAALVGAQNCTFVGYNAGKLTTGSGNTAFGASTMVQAVTGAGNTAVGFGAGSALAGADGNTLIGNTAGSGITSGDRNTYIGYGAGSGTLTGSDNTVLGYSVSLTTTQTGMLVVGNSVNATPYGLYSMVIGYGGNHFLRAFGLGNATNSYLDINTGLMLKTVTIGGSSTLNRANLVVELTGLSSTTDLWAAPLTGDTVYFKNSSGAPVTLDGNGKNIDNTATKTLDTGAGAMLTYNGTQWLVVTNTTVAAGGGLLVAATGTRNYGTVDIGAVDGTLTGQDNIGIGTNALTALLGGNRNLAMGTSAGAALTSGSSNIALGNNSGAGLTVAEYSIAVGVDVAVGLTTSVGQFVAIGHGALQAGTTTNNTVAIGYATMGACGVSLPSGCTAVGTQAMYYGRASTTVSNSCIAIGAQAMYGNSTPASNTGTNAIAIGYRALYTLTSGARNLAIGNGAGDALTTGGDNIAIGNNALSTASTVSYNLAIGQNALSGVAGARNIAIGYSAMISATSAAYNTVMGIDACAGVMTGDGYNVAIGYQVAGALANGSNNVLVGYSAATSITTGSNNTVVGAAAFTSAAIDAGSNVAVGKGALTGGAGSFNIAIGASALSVATACGHNIAIGYFTLSGGATSADGHNIAVGDYAADAVTSGVQNVVVGGYAFSAATTAAYNVAIGHEAFSGSTLAGSTYSTAVGWRAGYSITTTADNSVFIGREAGIGAATCSTSVLIGAQAGATGSYNSIIGIGYNVRVTATKMLAIGYDTNHIIRGYNIDTANTCIVDINAGLRLKSGTTAVSETIVRGRSIYQQTASGITTTLWASPVLGDAVWIKNNGGGANTIAPNAGTIEGAASIPISDGEAVLVYYDGTEWRSL